MWDYRDVIKDARIRSLERENKYLRKILFSDDECKKNISYVQNLVREINSLHRKLSKVRYQWGRYYPECNDMMRDDYENDLSIARKEINKLKNDIRIISRNDVGDDDKDVEIRILRGIKESQEEQIQELLQEISAMEDEMNEMCKGCYYKDKIHEIEEALE